MNKTTTDTNGSELDVSLKYDNTIAMLRANPDVIFRMKFDGTIIDLHAPPKSLILPIQSFQNANIKDVLTFEQGIECLSLIKKAIETEEVQLFNHDTLYQGKKYYFEGRIVKNDEDIIMIVRDITSQKNAKLLNDILYKIAVQSSGDEISTESFCQYIEDQLSRLIDVTEFYIARTDDANSLSFIHLKESEFRAPIPHQRKNGKGLTEYVIQTGKPLFIQGKEVLKFKEQNDRNVYGPVPKCYVGAPMMFAGKPIGIIACVSYTNENLYDESDLELLTAVGNQIGLWIERKKVEEERFSFNKIFEKSLNEIYIFDTENFRFLYMNDGARKNLGYTKEEILLLSPIDIEEEFNFESFKEAVTPLKEGENSTLRFESIHTRKNGTRYPVEVHLQCSEFKGEKAFIAIMLDITERKAAEKAIKESETQFRTLAEYAPSYIIKLNKNYIIDYVNRAPLGLKIEDMLGKSSFDFIYPPNLEWIKKKLANVFKTGQPTYYQNSRLDQHGELMHNGTHVGPILNDDGEVDSIILVIHDITEETLAKEKVESSYSELKLIDKINQASIENRPTEDLIALTMNSLEEVIDMIGGRFYLFDDQKDQLIIKDERMEDSLLKKIEKKLGYKMNSIIPSIKEGSLFYDAINKQKIIVARDKEEIIQLIADHTDNPILKTFAKWARGLIKIKTFLVIPLVSNKVLFGLLTITSDKNIEDSKIEMIKRFTNGITASLAKSLAEHETKRQKEFTEDLLNNLPADIAVFTPDHKYQFVNSSAIKDEKMRKWIIGKDDFEYCEKKGIDTDIAESRSDLFNDVIKGEKNIEWTGDHIQKDGSHQYILRKLFPIMRDDSLKYVVGFGLDITERKIAEDRLIYSEERYRSLFEQMNQGLLLISPEGIIQMVNPMFIQMTGYKENELIGTTGHYLVEDAKGVQNLEDRLSNRKKGISEKYETEIITKSGEKIWIAVSATPQFDRNGAYNGSMSIINDISDERQAEIASSVMYNIATTVSSEELNLQNLCEYIQHELGRFIDTANFYICLEKDSESIEFPYLCDAKSSKGISFTRKKDKGISEYIIEHGENVLLNGAELPKFQKENKLTIHGENAKSWIGAPIFIKNKVIGVIACQSYLHENQYNSTHLDLLAYVGRQIGMFIDQIKIDKSKEEFTRDLELKVKERTSELEISENESKYQLDTLNEIALVSITDTKGNITYANEIFCNTSGYSEEELIGKSHRILKSGLQSDDLFKELWTSISNGKIWKGEVLNKAKDGTNYWVNTTIVPFFDLNGKIEKYVSVRFNITEQKELQNQLERSLEKEKELGKLKSRFVSTASHQFRTPMTIIQSNSELLNIITQNSDENIKRKLGKATARIKSEVMRMTTLMNEILILGKISAGKMDVKKSSTNILSVCEELCEKYNSIQTDNRKVEFNVIGEAREVIVDQELMDHAISNLLSNAFKYSEKENPVLDLIFDKDEFTIHVKDKGIGIPKKELEDLFLPFHRAINVGDIPGTGLGLTIVKDYIELNDGTISIESIEGGDTIFTIKIPTTANNEE